jgi:dephospho-CoA kinase
MLRVGLTGSIGVGKSFVASVLSDLGCHVLDADQTAREVVAPGTPGLRAVAQTFGNEVLRDDGTLDRQLVATLVFGDEKKRQLLNAILHPFILAEQDAIMRQWEKEDPDGIGVVDAALMIESGGYKRFDKLIVVHCRPEVQLERLMNRNGLSLEQATQRINSQLSQSEKRKFGDYLIDTSDGLDQTRERTAEVYKELRQLTRGRK